MTLAFEFSLAAARVLSTMRRTKHRCKACMPRLPWPALCREQASPGSPLAELMVLSPGLARKVCKQDLAGAASALCEGLGTSAKLPCRCCVDLVAWLHHSTHRKHKLFSIFINLDEHSSDSVADITLNPITFGVHMIGTKASITVCNAVKCLPNVPSLAKSWMTFRPQLHKLLHLFVSALDLGPGENVISPSPKTND